MDYSLADLFDQLMDVVIPPRANETEMEKFRILQDDFEVKFKEMGIKRIWED